MKQHYLTNLVNLHARERKEYDKKKKQHTSLERYWLKSLFPSNSSLHSSNASAVGEVPTAIFFLSIRWKETSKIALQISWLMNADTPFFSFSASPELNPKLLTAELSPEICAAAFVLDSDSLITTC